MARSSVLHVRIDAMTKEKACEVLGTTGLSLSDAVRIFLKRIAADRAFPFMPNTTTRAALAEADEMIAEGSVRFKRDG